jgi:hypothetical protein
MAVTMLERITGGVDTQLDVHVAAALDQRGALLETRSVKGCPTVFEGSL